MPRDRAFVTRCAVTLAILATLAGSTIAAPTRHVLAGSPAIQASYTTSWAIHVLGYYFRPNTTVPIYEFTDNSKVGYAVHYATTDASGHFDTTFWSGVCASRTDTIQAYDAKLGWSSAVSLAAIVC